MTAANAALLALLLLGAALLALGEWARRLSALLLNLAVLLLAAVAVAASVALIHVAPSLALRLFAASLGALLGVGVERLATDCVLLAVGFVAA